MINTLVAKVFGTKNEREVKRLMPQVEAINALEPAMKKLSDAELRAKTDEFRQRIQERLSHIADEPEADADRIKQIETERNLALKEILDELLVEAFAVAREASWRVLNMRHFDVQLVGGMVLHQGKIAEMKTGEGKTLVATLPVYLNALSGRGVHVVTVNDYLAKRDSEWMGKLYTFLGLSVGVIVHDLDDEERREAYAADVTYGTNNEFGFDYLRDNMKFDLKDCVQRVHNYAIVDEVDSILIDEARTPLIISGASEESTDKYDRVNRIIPKLERGEEIEVPPGEPKIYTGDFVVDEKHKNITVSDEGWEKVEKLLGIGNIADPENWDLKHHVETAVKAHALYRRDVEYVVKAKDDNPREKEVIIVDEFTGRMMPGRRWSDGLHQAIEAKENVKIERENQTLATITFQNYFRMYKKLAGMTGTAETEAPEFDKIYRLEVLVIPTNKTLLRIENPDVVYRTEKEKYFAAADEIQRLNQSNQPVLVGTTSIEKSERLSELLKKKGIKHVVLNAKYHEREAEIVAQAGRKGCRHHRDEHGGPRYRHPAGRQSRIHGQAGMREEGNRAASARGARQGASHRRRREHDCLVLRRQRIRRSDRAMGGRLSLATRRRPTSSTRKSSPPADCTSSAPSAMKPGASITSCVGAPDDRAILVHRASTSRWKTTSCASSPRSGCRTSSSGWAWKKACLSSPGSSRAGLKPRRKPWKPRTSKPGNTCSSTTM